MLIHPVIKGQICKLEVDHLKPVEWFTLFRVLRQKGLAASFYIRLVNAEKDKLIPAVLLDAFISAYRFSLAQTHQVHIQLNKLRYLFTKAEIEFVMLKGAAYVAANIPNSEGRLMSDIDICVRQADIPDIERLLQSASWRVKELDDHDEKYYREWSHELPPYTHPIDGVSLDIHHTIFPPVSNKSINVQTLFSEAKTGVAGVKYPASEWLIFHSAVHLLANEDVENGLRDLIDIYLMLTTESITVDLTRLSTLFLSSGFKDELLLLRELLNDYFDYKMEIEGVDSLRHSVIYTVRLWALRRALSPRSPFIPGTDFEVARLINYVIGYAQKMPPGLLCRHFLFKTGRNVVKLMFGDFYYRKNST